MAFHEFCRRGGSAETAETGFASAPIVEARGRQAYWTLVLFAPHVVRDDAAPTNYPLQIAMGHSKIRTLSGVLAQLVERLNGIEEVRGSNPLGSTPFLSVL